MAGQRITTRGLVARCLLLRYWITRHLGSLYLVGHKVQDKRIRTWRVDRIDSAEVDAVPFTLPPGLDLGARFASSFGIYDGGAEERQVKIRFSRALARFVQEKQWHPSQQLSPQRDGGLIVEFRLSSTIEVKSWALSFGRDALVLQPDDLRDELARVAADMHAAYGPTAQAPRPHPTPSPRDGSQKESKKRLPKGNHRFVDGSRERPLRKKTQAGSFTVEETVGGRHQ
jgi:hypothetical protein